MAVQRKANKVPYSKVERHQKSLKYSIFHSRFFSAQIVQFHHKQHPIIVKYIIKLQDIYSSKKMEKQEDIFNSILERTKKKYIYCANLKHFF